MEYKPLPVGVDNFEKLITRGYYFVDKTWFIKELIDKRGDVNLFARPRRFGKTLNMSMLQYFFEDARDRDGERVCNSYLFEGMEIMQAGEKYLCHMSQYPVINLSLKSGRQPNFELAYAMEIESLIEGKTLVKPIHEDITYDEVYKTMDNLWNFMFFTGYFRKVSDYLDERTKTLYAGLAVPNEEVKCIFRRKILSWFDEGIKKKDRTRLLQAVVDGDAQTMEEELTQLLLETISFNDAYENFYHGFLAGVLSGMKGYIVKSNREGGYGRSDLFISPVTRRKAAFVLEFKIAKSIRQLDEKALEAIRQIKDRKYMQELYDNGYEIVHKYGIAFFVKDCHVAYEE